MHLIWSLVILLSPVGVMVAVIGGTLWWCCWFGDRQVARKKRAELLARFLKEIFEPMLYEELKNMRLLEGSCFTLGVGCSDRANILYKMFEELGGIKALSPEKAEWWERTLQRLAYKFDLDMEHVGKGSIRFSRPIRES